MSAPDQSFPDAAPARPVRIHHLGVRNFRNYEVAALPCDGRHICFFGPNGGGKTSLLEALSLLAPGRGMRNAAFAALMRHGAETGWEVSVRLGGESEQSIRIAAVPDGERARRRLYMDGAPAEMSNLADRVRLLWLGPGHDRIFAGSDGDRRRFFDRLTLAHIPDHGRSWRLYESAMRERNALLEQQRRPDTNWLDALEARMAKAGSVVAGNRASAVMLLRRAIAEVQAGGFPQAEIAMKESFACTMENGLSMASAEDIAACLYRNRSKDAAARRTLAGIHRTGFEVWHGGKSLPAALCSAGEQKVLLVGLILAAARAFLAGDTGKLCLLLLDEAAARLDSVRREALCEAIMALDGQALLTGTDQELFMAFKDKAQMVRIENGQILPMA